MAAFVTDSFTDTNGTLLTAHTGELGATWTALTGSAFVPTIQSNKLDAGIGSTINALYYASGVPATADYTATAVITLGSAPAPIAGSAVRCSTSEQTGYFGFYFGGGGTVFSLYKYVAGVLTQIGVTPNATVTAGADYAINTVAAGTTIKLSVQRVSDGFWLNSSAAWASTAADCISVTDSSITAVGRAGFWLSQDTTSGSSKIDSFSADQVSSGATATTLTGPSGGANGVASTNFTVGANGAITGTVIVTPSSGGGGGTFTPTTVSISAGTPTATFTYTPASVGAKTISVTNNGSLTNPASITYTVTAAAIYNRVDATDTIGAQNIMVLAPNSSATNPYNAANPTNVILYAHGAGEDQTALVADALKSSCVTALINAGYILAGTNARGNNWGNQASVDDYAALDKYVRDNYNVANVCIWSQSMGGLDGLLALSQGKIKAVGWLGTYPVCSLANLYSLSTYTADINTAFGITGTGIATYANKTWGNDPALKQGVSWRHVPMRFYASAGDTVVPKANNTDVLAALVAGSCRESVTVVCTGNHGDPSHFDPTSYAAFFARCFATPVESNGSIGINIPFNPGAAGTITLPAFKNDSGQVQAGIVISTLHVQTPGGITVATFTGLTANSSGVLAPQTHANIIIGTTYRCVGYDAAGNEFRNKVTAT